MTNPINRAPSGSVRYHDVGGDIYVEVKVMYHPEFGCAWVREHTLVWWQNTGEHVRKPFCLHHVDEDTFNNDFSNLEKMSLGKHIAHHRYGKPSNNRRKEVA